jgi:tRNA pseudouridine38-40 synthase
MPRLKATIAYDGTHFSGYQVQPGKRTVQLAIESSLKQMHKGQDIRITASGRTDAGVHAVGQVIHFDSSFNIPEVNWPRALNALLPDDIYIKKVENVSDQFHARFDVTQKEYRFKLLNRSSPDLFRRLYTVHIPEPLDIGRMQEAADYIKGTHDFTSFCAANTSVVDKVRTISLLEVLPAPGDEIHVRMKGNGFLYQMVRIIVGQLVTIGKGKAEPAIVQDILNAKDRQKAFPTAPPQGLYLWEVKYPSLGEI